VKQAMPWVNIRKNLISGWNDDMNSIFVCVRDTDGFKAEFGTIVQKSRCGIYGWEQGDQLCQEHHAGSAPDLHRAIRVAA